MQPPPPPLDIAAFKALIAQADLIVVGEVIHRNESSPDAGQLSKSLEITVDVEKSLTKNNCGKHISIRESFPAPLPDKPLPLPGNITKDTAGPAISAAKVGPSAYHGVYHRGERIILLLSDTGNACQFRPIGSGTYDRHLGEFLIVNGKIETLYYTFAPDLKRYADSETSFLQLLDSLIAAAR